MPQVCSVLGCESKYVRGAGIRFHAFPKGREQRLRWVQLCQRSDINPNTARICSLHFPSEAFERNLKYELLALPVPKSEIKFKKDAIPTLHLPARPRPLREEVTMAAFPIKRRRPNFSSDELKALLREVTPRKAVIMGKLDSTRATKEAKNHAWTAVTEAVNEVSIVRRTEEEVRKKFCDFRSLTKKKISDARQELPRTGGGPTTPTQLELSSAEEAMAAIIKDVDILGHSEVPDVEEVPGDFVTKEEEYPEDPLMIIEDAYSIPVEMSPGSITGDTLPSSPHQEVSAPSDPSAAEQETQDGSTPSSHGRRYPRMHNSRERQRNLHTVFVRKKKLPPNGLGRKTAKPNYLMDVLQILLPYINERQPTNILGNLASLEQTSEEVNEDNSQEIVDEHCEGNVPQESDAIPSTHNKGANATERKKRGNMSAGDQTFIDFVNLKKARINSDDDPRKLFLMSLLPDVHAMTEVQMRKFRKLVLDAVDTVLEEPSSNTHKDSFHTMNMPSSHVDPCHTVNP